MHIAIVSTDGQTVNDHFGKAERFLIYDSDGTPPVFIEERTVRPFSSGEQNHAFNRTRFENILAALAGCREVYCTRIGDKPTEELGKAGIEPVIYEGPINAIR
ncbi:MAG: dinitrogenase iron-molybdenum cofactor biosynthesis protein [Desulfuromonadales bacterium]|nr:dinitrogenase iron-molybdenum cofactor biosynthesis protein [Desulfuromonadales bacterium]